VLPAALFTEFFVSGNLLNLLKFVTIRTHEGAQAEMVEAAQAVKVVLAALFPHTVELWNK
jgi:thymidylate synthase ThyX